MAVFRVDKSKDYTVMSNYHLRDKKLSLKAKGLLSQMLSLPDDWDYTLDGLVYFNAEGARAVRSGLAELKDAGYLVVTKLYPNETESGKIEYVYNIFEQPQNQDIQNVAVDLVPVENVSLQNGTQINTNIHNTNIQNTNNNNKERKIEKRDDLTAILYDNEPTKSSEELRDSFIDFIKMRKAIKKPLTEKGLKLSINKAYQLAGGNVDKMIKIVDQSVMNSWQGLFELKEQPTAARNVLEQLEELERQEGII